MGRPPHLWISGRWHQWRAGALQRATEKIEFVQVRHEEMAAFMASAHAKFTGELGVCLSTGGPGASHLITGLYDAKCDHMPVLAIAGQAPRTARGAHYQQELNLDRMFSDVAAFVQEAETPSQVRMLTDRAVRIAKAQNAVSVIVLPGDLQDLDYEDPPRKHGAVQTGVGYSRPLVVPCAQDIHRAADVLNAGRKVAILIGAGALGAREEVIAVAEKLKAGVAKALLGKAAAPDTLPWVTGSIGLLGTKPSYDMMMACDTLLMIGSGFPYSEFLPQEGQARGVQIDIDASMLSMRYPMEVNLHGDAAATLRELLLRLDEKTDLRWRDWIERKVSDWWELLEDRALAPANPVNPQKVAWELSPRLPEDSIITCDSRLLRQLVRARSEDQGRDDVFPLRRARLHGRRRALRHRREIRPSRTAGDRSRGRRRHADEQYGRTHHGFEILARLGKSEMDLLRLQ